jgi:hypothetical protein
LMKPRQHLTLNLKWKFRPLSRLLPNPALNWQSWLLLIVWPLSRVQTTYFTFSQGPSWFKLPSRWRWRSWSWGNYRRGGHGRRRPATCNSGGRRRQR